MRRKNLRLMLDEKERGAIRLHGVLKNGVLEIGAIAQLGERLNGIQEVSGSIPLGSI